MSVKRKWSRRLGTARGSAPSRSLRRLRRDDEAVSEVVGSVLLVSITVIITVALGTLVASVYKPTELHHSELDVRVSAGDLNWGNGDEQISITQRGGEALPKEGTRVLVDVGTLPRETFEGDDLDGAFSDGELSIGETWTKQIVIPPLTRVDLTITTVTSTGDQVIAFHRVTSGVPDPSCGSDTDPPFVSQWTSVPAHVTGASPSAVSITARLADNCSGIEETANPHLTWRINNGSDPAFTDAGAMTLVSTNTWQGTVNILPDSWSNHVGKTFQYRLTGMQDGDGNVGPSEIQSDPIEVGVTTFTYPSSRTDVNGTTTNFANVGADDGAEATLTETSGTDSVGYTLFGSTSSTVGGSDHENARSSPDNLYATLPKSGNSVSVGGFLRPAGAGNITKIEIGVEAKYALELLLGAYDNDEIRLSHSMGGSAGDFALSNVDQRFFVDVTADRSWTWADVQAMEVTGAFKKAGTEDTIDVLVDSLFVRVEAVSTVYVLEVQMDFSGVPLGSTQVLEIEYRAAGEFFDVEVFDGSGWNQRGVVLDQTVTTAWTYTMTVSEYNGGSPMIRFVDVDPESGVQGTLDLDYVRVKTD